jgi:membrane protein implicated in regulation of membrane protease activity
MNNAFSCWLVLSVICIIIELTSATIYLLFLALTFALVAALAWLHTPFILQVILAGILSVFSIFCVNKFKQKKSNIKNSKNINISSNNLDIGQSVMVEAWQGNYAQVSYKGSYWKATFFDEKNTQILPSGEYIICDTRANVLLLKLKN